MAQFTIRGQVVGFGAQQRNIRVQNVEDLRQFWEAEGIATRLDWAGDNPPLVTVSSEELVNRCQPGDEVLYVIETQDRASGRGIKGVSLEVIRPA